MVHDPGSGPTAAGDDRPQAAAPATEPTHGPGAEPGAEPGAGPVAVRPCQDSGVQLPGGDVSTKASGSKISASISMPSITRGPGREK